MKSDDSDVIQLTEVLLENPQEPVPHAAKATCTGLLGEQERGGASSICWAGNSPHRLQTLLNLSTPDTWDPLRGALLKQAVWPGNSGKSD